MRSAVHLWLLVSIVVVTACTKTSTSYFPLDAGRSWEYEQFITILNKTAQQKQIYRNLSTGRWQGQTVAVQELPTGVRRYYADTAEGIVRLVDLTDSEAAQIDAHGGQFVIRQPIQPGTTWQLTSRLALIESRTFEPADRIIPRRTEVMLNYVIESLDDEVTVPAGRFAHCLRVHATGSAVVEVNRGYDDAAVNVEHTDWYARGVGLIKSSRREYSDSDFLMAGEYKLELQHFD